MSFWSPDNKQDIGEQLSVVVRSDNSLEYGEGDEIRIEIPTSIEYIDPKQCYLQLDCLVSQTKAGSGNPRVYLDHKLGGQILIKDIRIMANNKQVLIESIEDYNKYVSIIYDYEDNEVLRQKRGLTEGAVPKNIDLINNIDDSGQFDVENNDCKTNPYFINNADGTFTYKKAKMCLKLQAGLFSQEHIIPNALLGGLSVVITTESNNKVFETLESTSLFQSGVKYKRGMTFVGIDTEGANLANGGKTNDFFFLNDNNIFDLDDVPFRVGDVIKLIKDDKTQDSMEILIDTISLADGTKAPINNFKLIKITVDAEITNSLGFDIVSGASFAYNHSLDKLTAFTPKYTLSNVDFIVQEVKLTSQAEAQLMKSLSVNKKAVYDFTSVQNYKYSALSNDIALNMRIPIQNKKSFCLLSMPTDSSLYTDADKINAKGTYLLEATRNSSRSGYTGIYDNMKDYQFYYEKLQPSRAVNVEKYATDGLDATHMVELEKALRSADILPLSMKKVKENFVIGRAFSVNGGVYDPTMKDFNVMINYTTNGTKNKLFHNFVVHKRRINIDNTSGSITIDI